MFENVEKKLGVGVEGETYLVTYKNQKMIMKVGLYDGYTDSRSQYHRQIIFHNEVASKYPEHFMQLHDYKIIENTSSFRPKLSNRTYMTNEEYNSRLETGKLYLLYYTPVLHYTLHSVSNGMSDNDKVNVIADISETITILRRHGYYHRDIHCENLMYSRDLHKWFIIDYGYIFHDKFVKANIDSIGKPDDFLQLLWHTIMENHLLNFIVSKKIKCRLFVDTINYIKKSNLFSRIVKIIGKRKNEDYILMMAYILDVEIFAKCMNIETYMKKATGTLDESHKNKLLGIMVQMCK